MEEIARTVPEKSEINVIKYRRRLDRYPKGDFDGLPEDHKVLISRLRTALEEAKGKSVKLKEENEFKDDIIEEERQHRKIVEERLQKLLVDVYNNPKIISELRERLPKAKIYDPLHIDDNDDVKSHDPSVKETIAHPSVEEFNEKVISSSKDSNIQASVAYGNSCSLKSPETTLLSPIQTDEITFTSQNPIQAHTATLSQYSTPLVNADSHAVISPETFTCPSVPNFTASSTSITTVLSSSFLDLPRPGLTDERGHEVGKEGEIQLQAVTQENNYSPIKSTPSLQNNQENYTENMQKGNPHFSPMSTINYHYGQFYQPNKDNVSHLTRLLAEISTLKKENQELKTELEEKKHDLQILKDDLQEAKHEGDKDDSAAALIEMIHSAGKTREQALAQMVSSAVQDRDAVLGELDRLRLKATEKSLPCTSVSNIDCSELEDTDEHYVTSGCISVDTDPIDMTETLGSDTEPSLEELRNLLSRQREIMQEEMKEVLQQRDQALLKVLRLEKRLSSFELSEFSDETVDSLKAKLRITETERDIAISKLRKISEDFGEVKLLNNLKHALVHDYVNADLKVQKAAKNRQQGSDKWDAMKSNNMTASMNKTVEENNKLEKKVVLLEYQNKEQSQQIEKLQALVTRQRHKLNALCAGPLLIEDEL